MAVPRGVGSSPTATCSIALCSAMPTVSSTTMSSSRKNSLASPTISAPIRAYRIETDEARSAGVNAHDLLVLRPRGHHGIDSLASKAR